MRNHAPDIQSRTSGAPLRGQIVLAMVGAFAISYIAKMSRFDKKSAAQATITTGKSIVGWFVVLIVLSAMSDFGSTQELAVAFALLIFLTALLVNGPAALKTIQSELNNSAQSPRGLASK